jgi:hypothetical protein
VRAVPRLGARVARTPPGIGAPSRGAWRAEEDQRRMSGCLRGENWKHGEGEEGYDE